jgi:hypothetical protein
MKRQKPITSINIDPETVCRAVNRIFAADICNNRPWERRTINVILDRMVNQPLAFSSLLLHLYCIRTAKSVVENMTIYNVEGLDDLSANVCEALECMMLPVGCSSWWMVESIGYSRDPSFQRVAGTLH